MNGLTIGADPGFGAGLVYWCELEIEKGEFPRKRDVLTELRVQVPSIGQYKTCGPVFQIRSRDKSALGWVEKGLRTSFCEEDKGGSEREVD